MHPPMFDRVDINGMYANESIFIYVLIRLTGVQLVTLVNLITVYTYVGSYVPCV